MAKFQKVAKLGDVEIFSDLELKKIDGENVWFNDGSTCNARTGEVNCIGDGRIIVERINEKSFNNKNAVKIDGLKLEGGLTIKNIKG